jgi:hypothetical protein
MVSGKMAMDRVSITTTEAHPRNKQTHPATHTQPQRQTQHRKNNRKTRNTEQQQKTQTKHNRTNKKHKNALKKKTKNEKPY